MTSYLLTPPASEPLLLADVKTWLKVDVADDDILIGALITAARMIVESATRRMLITQSWRLILDAWPQTGLVDIDLVPFQSIAAINVFDADNVAQLLNPATWFVDVCPDAARLLFANAPPAPSRLIAGIQIDIVLGYGASAAAIPPPLLQAMKMLVARWYENRGDVLTDSGATRLPASVAALLAPYRVVRLT